MSAPTPQQQCALAIVTAKPIGDRKERAVENRAIVIGQIDEPGLDDESTEFDQVARAFAPRHGP